MNAITAPHAAEPRILVFARTPRAGRTKTRLARELGPGNANRVHQRLVLRTLREMSRVPGVRIELWVYPATGHGFLQSCRRRFGVALHKQFGRDLGRRMWNAIRHAHRYTDRVLLLGSDLPTVNAEQIQSVLDPYRAGFKGVVIVPSLDGGYGMIAMRRPAVNLFLHIAWGERHVLRQTLRPWRIGTHTVVMPFRLPDLDSPADYRRYRKGLEEGGDGVELHAQARRP